MGFQPWELEIPNGDGNWVKTRDTIKSTAEE